VEEDAIDLAAGRRATGLLYKALYRRVGKERVDPEVLRQEADAMVGSGAGKA
jgi:hypothetical protein